MTEGSSHVSTGSQNDSFAPDSDAPDPDDDPPHSATAALGRDSDPYREPPPGRPSHAPQGEDDPHPDAASSTGPAPSNQSRPTGARPPLPFIDCPDEPQAHDPAFCAAFYLPRSVDVGHRARTLIQDLIRWARQWGDQDEQTWLM